MYTESIGATQSIGHHARFQDIELTSWSTELEKAKNDVTLQKWLLDIMKHNLNDVS